LPVQDAPEAGRVILRDGSTAHMRLAQAADVDALLAFFQRLSPAARQQRFFSAMLPPPALIARLCDSTAPQEALTLVVTRFVQDVPRIIATGSYLPHAPQVAEVAFAVDDAFQGMGLGTFLLERLAILAVQNGFTRFWALTHADNQAMRDVFRESGFAAGEQLDRNEVEVDLSVLPTAASVARLEGRDRIATVASLLPFFRPAAVAVVGASRDPQSIGYRTLRALLDAQFQGQVYPVNPRAETIAGLTVHPTVAALPDGVNLAVIVVPRDAVLGVVDECAARGVRALVVITAGFAEVPGPGQELQRQLVERVRGHGMRLIGPNCMGLLNTDPAVRLNASFAPLFPPCGRVAMLSQSGALGLAVLQAARRLDLGLSTFVSVGNKADVSGNDLLQYWEEDPNTDVILLYLESFGNPRRFARLARRVAQRKPIVALKSGRTPAGERAAGSHTAALAAREVAVDALFQQTGVIRAETLEEMFDLAACLGRQPLPPGRRVAVVTNAGGPGILCADACEAGGLRLGKLADATQTLLRGFLPATAGLGNPVDMIASATPAQYEQTVQAVLTAAEVDAVIVIYIPVDPGLTEAVQQAIQRGVALGRSAGAAAKPVLLCLMSAEGQLPSAVAGGERLPTYAFPEAPARALSKAVTYAEWRAQPAGVLPDFDDLDLATARRVCSAALSQRGPGWLTAAEIRTVLEALRLPAAPGGVAASAAEAVALAEGVGYPVVVKLASTRLVHKTEVDGVQLHLADAAAVRQAWDTIQQRLTATNQQDAFEGVVVQPMLKGGTELMMGATLDPLFGPLVAFGLGGIHVEVLADVRFAVTPLTDRDAAALVRNIRGFRLLQGYRGHPPADLPAIEDCLLRLARLVEEIHLIAEIDLNPVFALPPGQGCRIADARIQVRQP